MKPPCTTLGRILARAAFPFRNSFCTLAQAAVGAVVKGSGHDTPCKAIDLKVYGIEVGLNLLLFFFCRIYICSSSWFGFWQRRILGPFYYCIYDRRAVLALGSAEYSKTPEESYRSVRQGGNSSAPSLGAAIRAHHLPLPRCATFRSAVGSIRLLRCAASRFGLPPNPDLGIFCLWSQTRGGCRMKQFFPAYCLYRACIYNRRLFWPRAAEGVADLTSFMAIASRTIYARHVWLRCAIRLAIAMIHCRTFKRT